MRTILFLILVVITGGSQAQETPACPCCTENHRAFDFWLGEWSVYGTNEALLGGNTIVSMQDGCVLQENWEGASAVMALAIISLMLATVRGTKYG
ncbi:hypothetical protein NYZ99_11250 [Maribacter litopenaei]|uniref:Uncharacterized protein n=1 Tax=Maribacter litopenaei TaxID=2976127 RepID=A0ABY5Y4Y9_9FLAO|nr:hypothetical protein [Maribacter litopenaei]UWX53724.1 hypothetical protein NYZ99_11250 [Maribacter litopenaei]